MKWLLYIFLLANLAVFFWHYQPGLFRADVSKPVAESVDADSVPQLVLLREYESKQQAPTPVTDGQSCFTLGPFTKRKDAANINKELTALGIMANLQVNKDKTRAGFWVLMPPVKDRKAAQKVIAQLKEKKIKDYFRVATGSQKNAISLGVFSRADLAQQRLQQMKKLGFTVSIEKVDLPKREYWLEWPSTSEVSIDTARLDDWRKRYPAIGSTRQTCHEKP